MPCIDKPHLCYTRLLVLFQTYGPRVPSPSGKRFASIPPDLRAGAAQEVSATVHPSEHCHLLQSISDLVPTLTHVVYRHFAFQIPHFSFQHLLDTLPGRPAARLCLQSGYSRILSLGTADTGTEVVSGSAPAPVAVKDADHIACWMRRYTDQPWAIGIHPRPPRYYDRGHVALVPANRHTISGPPDITD